MSSLSSPRPADQPIANRVRAFLLHVPWYSIEGQRRLAADCGVAGSTISRIIRGQASPTYYLACKITDAIAKRLGIPLDMREIFSSDGTYPTARVCDIIPYCHGCFPDEAFDEEDNLRPEYQAMRPGDWCCYPTQSDHHPSTP